MGSSGPKLDLNKLKPYDKEEDEEEGMKSNLSRENIKKLKIAFSRPS